MAVKSAHIFIDNSNVIGGARGAAEWFEKAVPALCVRIYFSNFFDLIEGSYNPSTKFLSGSRPPSNEALWAYAKGRNYDTALLHRVDDGDRNREQGVDEIIHAKMMRVLLKRHDHQDTLVLVTGDGQEGEFGTSFTEILRFALGFGWDVEVWSWKKQLSGNLKRLGTHATRPDQYRIYNFDSKYFRLVFVEGNGICTYNNSNIIVRNRSTNLLEEGDRAACRTQ